MFILLIPKIDDNLKILTNDEMRDFVAINFSEYFKSTREKPQNHILVFPTAPDEVEKFAKIMESNSSDNCEYRYNIGILDVFDHELQLINSKPMIQNKLKEFLSEFRQL